MKIIFVITMAC